MKIVVRLWVIYFLSEFLQVVRTAHCKLLHANPETVAIKLSTTKYFLHAQRPPIVHRDLKPENFLIKNGAYKLCDFGSAVFGHVELKTPKARQEAEEVIEKTTTQMFRAPEMVDLYMAKKLTQATDVWALGSVCH